MMNITIGRNPKSTISVSDSYDTVSYDHAEIYMDGVNIMFIDHSSNGTVINDQKIQNLTVSIYRGDVIKLAGRYLLSWDVIEQYVGIPGRPTVTRNSHGEIASPVSPDRNGRVTWNKNEVVTPGQRLAGIPSYNDYERREPERNAWASREENDGRLSPSEEKDIDAWNWGAFFFGWIWGVFNKVYLSLVQLVCNVVIFFANANGLLAIGAVFQLASLGVAIWMGVKGSRLAWNQHAYDSFEHFKRVRHGWNIAALITFCVLILVSILSLLLFMDVISRLV
ncbi:MAG: FHA domain-containing protein [Bacteroidaceae bacterium]|nr:FHA domain-containing protein [Bacteroidaceae bacterium]